MSELYKFAMHVCLSRQEVFSLSRSQCDAMSKQSRSGLDSWRPETSDYSTPTPTSDLKLSQKTDTQNTEILKRPKDVLTLTCKVSSQMTITECFQPSLKIRRSKDRGY
jgi:hypothetical protein